jgi:predicted RNase H-like HicB family nuclease
MLTQHRFNCFLYDLNPYGRRMSLENYDFDGWTIELSIDEQGDWLARFPEMPNISAFGDDPLKALEELKNAWELVKEDYREKGLSIPLFPHPKSLATG